ncbi:hypothetical protein AB3S75_046335 [Citrus x aurantiifolia]
MKDRKVFDEMRQVSLLNVREQVGEQKQKQSATDENKVVQFWERGDASHLQPSLDFASCQYAQIQSDSLTLSRRQMGQVAGTS